MTDPTPAPVARDEIAAVIWAHQPRREKSGRIHGCTCNAWFSQIGVEASHRAHLADALLASPALAARQPEGNERVEWGVRFPEAGGVVVRFPDRREAERAISTSSDGEQVVSRRVGEWTEVNR